MEERVADSTGRHTARLSAGDFVAGLRILLLPVAVVAVLLAAGSLFQGADPAAPMPPSWLARLPRQAWAWALLAYLAAIAPRHATTLRLPGLPLAAKGLIVALCGLCFWLEARYDAALAPLLQGLLACVLAAACALAAAAVAHDGRMRRRQAGEARDRMLEQMILKLEQHSPGDDPALTHPALFAEVGSILKAGSAFGTSIWFLRPHPALDHRRPIDVLREPGGEARLLQASRLGPNS
jgi:hypothetical protein